MKQINIVLAAMVAAIVIMMGCMAQSEPAGAPTEAYDPVTLTAEEVAAWAEPEKFEMGVQTTN